MSETIEQPDRTARADGRADLPHEPNAINTPGVVKFIGWLSASVVIIALALWGWFRYLDLRQAESEGPPPPPVRRDRLPPEPRLQGAPGHAESPSEDLREFRQQEDQMLHGYGWVDERNGVVRIPIDEAKKLIAERGLSPGRLGGAQPVAQRTEREQ